MTTTATAAVPLPLTLLCDITIIIIPLTVAMTIPTPAVLLIHSLIFHIGTDMVIKSCLCLPNRNGRHNCGVTALLMHKTTFFIYPFDLLLICHHEREFQRISANKFIFHPSGDRWKFVMFRNYYKRNLYWMYKPLL